jgi:hypothetical protein
MEMVPHECMAALASVLPCACFTCVCSFRASLPPPICICTPRFRGAFRPRLGFRARTRAASGSLPPALERVLRVREHCYAHVLSTHMRSPRFQITLNTCSSYHAGMHACDMVYFMMFRRQCCCRAVFAFVLDGWRVLCNCGLCVSWLQDMVWTHAFPWCL